MRQEQGNRFDHVAAEVLVERRQGQTVVAFRKKQRGVVETRPLGPAAREGRQGESRQRGD